MTSPTEPVLGHGQDSAAVELRLGILFYSEGKHRIYHMLEYVPTSELSILTYLTDYDGTGVVLLTPISNHSQCTFWSSAIGSVSVLTIIHGLQRVDY